MRRIVHLSDLHFGRVDAGLEAPLLRAVSALSPDLVVVSGDLTQRARDSQFRAARGFMDRLPQPVLCIPGNHDTPLDNLFMRFLFPFRGYRRHINPELEPLFEDDQMVVAGVNTVNRFSWQRGRIGKGRLARLNSRMSGAGKRLRVAVLHHPLEHEPNMPKRLMRGASEALSTLSDCGADLVLSGHLHVASSQPFRAVPDLLFVQAGTGLSTRRRGNAGNTFNQIDCDGDGLVVVTWSGKGDAEPGFFPTTASHWQRHPRGWHRVPDSEVGPITDPTPLAEFSRASA